MTAQTKTLRELRDTHANEHAFSIRVHDLTLRDLFLELRELLDEVPNHAHEGLSSCYRWDRDLMSTPRGADGCKARGFGPLTDQTRLTDIRYRWLCVFPVTGGNEGHYIHVDLLWQQEFTEGRVPLFLLKTFGGHAEAIKLAGILCHLLGV